VGNGPKIGKFVLSKKIPILPDGKVQRTSSRTTRGEEKKKNDWMEMSLIARSLLS